MDTIQISYSDFTLNRVAKDFNLTISERSDIFAEVPELAPSAFLQETLRDNMALALGSNTEKARSELIIPPILVELRKQLNYQISWFSGIDFSVDASKGLNGSCDFTISRSPEVLFFSAPVITINELAKLPEDERDFFKQMSSRSNKCQRQVKADLRYLEPGQKLFYRAIASIRGIVEIEQTEIDRNLQTTIAVVGCRNRCSSSSSS